MKRITVYADFDFHASPPEIGTLGYEHVRGKDHFVFEYSRKWLKQHAGIVLSGDLMNIPSLQHPRAKICPIGLLSMLQQWLGITNIRMLPDSFHYLICSPDKTDCCGLTKLTEAIKQFGAPLLLGLLVPNYFSHANSAFSSSIICSWVTYSPRSNCASASSIRASNSSIV